MLASSVIYFGVVLEESEAENYFKALEAEVVWHQDELIIFGRKIITNRLVAWYGDKDYEYTYSHNSKRALPWSPSLVKLKQLVETQTGFKFNSCLLNYYHHGEDGMGWHSDDEETLQKPIHIASLSLGAKRRFDFRHKQSKQKESLWLENGSLLLMKHPNQEEYQHCLPKTKKVKKARMNLTFRKMKEV